MAFLAAIPAFFGFGSAAAGGAAAAGSGISAGTALSAIGTGLSVAGTLSAGNAANAQAKQDALNMEAQGKEELAASQREAFQKRREGALINSRAQALAAAGGGGADDPTIVRLMTQTAKDAETNAGSVMYGGQSRRRGLYDSAKARRTEGKASLLGSIYGGFGQAASGLGKAFG
jgi:hypothetical protein